MAAPVLEVCASRVSQRAARQHTRSPKTGMESEKGLGRTVAVVKQCAGPVGQGSEPETEGEFVKTTTDDQVIVKQVIDLKGPLKGKGGSLAQWLKDTQGRLQELYAEMEQLTLESRSIEGRAFAMYVYKLRDARQLRWRLATGKHATWNTVQQRLSDLAPGLAQWYRQAEDVAQILNHREQVLRYEEKTVKRLMTVGARPLRTKSYSSSVGQGVGGGRPAKMAA
jgi:hypothetical protein